MELTLSNNLKEVRHLPEIVEYQNFMSNDECKDLIEYFELAKDSWREFCFYGSYGMNPSDGLEYENSKITLANLDAIRDSICGMTQKVFGEELQNTAASAHKWQPGSFAEPHADNTDENGNPSSWRQHKYVAILYLNDDYVGGELYFTQHNIEIAPKAGTLVIFNPNSENLHGVKMVTCGSRYTLLTSWDTAGAQYTDEFYHQRDKDEQIAKDFSAQKRKIVKQKIENGLYNELGVIND